MKEMRYESDILTNQWKEFFNEVAAKCEYWELGFGDINPEKESEVVRECFVEKYTVQHTVQYTVAVAVAVFGLVK